MLSHPALMDPRGIIISLYNLMESCPPISPDALGPLTDMHFPHTYELSPHCHRELPGRRTQERSFTAKLWTNWTLRVEVQRESCIWMQRRAPTWGLSDRRTELHLPDIKYLSRIPQLWCCEQTLSTRQTEEPFYCAVWCRNWKTINVALDNIPLWCVFSFCVTACRHNFSQTFHKYVQRL